MGRRIAPAISDPDNSGLCHRRRDALDASEQPAGGGWQPVSRSESDGPASTQTDYVVDVQISRTDLLQADTIRLVTETPDKQQGPGRTPHGNFVLSEFLVSVVNGDGQETPVGLLEGHASAEQNGYPIALATDGNPGTGWAINANGFVPKTATADWKLGGIPAIDERQTDAVFRIRLRQHYGEAHNIGQFRIEIGRRRSSEELQAVRDAEITARFSQWLDEMRPNAVNWKSLAPRQLQSNMAHLNRCRTSPFLPAATSQNRTGMRFSLSRWPNRSVPCSWKSFRMRACQVGGRGLRFTKDEPVTSS